MHSPLPCMRTATGVALRATPTAVIDKTRNSPRPMTTRSLTLFEIAALKDERGAQQHGGAVGDAVQGSEADAVGAEAQAVHDLGLDVEHREVGKQPVQSTHAADDDIILRALDPKIQAAQG